MRFWYLSMVEKPVLSGSIRMEGMQCFASKNKDFCMQIWMENSHKQSSVV